MTTLRAPVLLVDRAAARTSAPNFAATDPLVEAVARARIELLPIVVGTPGMGGPTPEAAQLAAGRDEDLRGVPDAP